MGEPVAVPKEKAGVLGKEGAVVALLETEAPLSTILEGLMLLLMAVTEAVGLPLILFSFGDDPPKKKMRRAGVGMDAEGELWGDELRRFLEDDVMHRFFMMVVILLRGLELS